MFLCCGGDGKKPKKSGQIKSLVFTKQICLNLNQNINLVLNQESISWEDMPKTDSKVFRRQQAPRGQAPNSQPGRTSKESVQQESLLEQQVKKIKLKQIEVQKKVLLENLAQSVVNQFKIRKLQAS